jgi:hypothetical protein
MRVSADRHVFLMKSTTLNLNSGGLSHLQVWNCEYLLAVTRITSSCVVKLSDGRNAVAADNCNKTGGGGFALMENATARRA